MSRQAMLPEGFFAQPLELKDVPEVVQMLNTQSRAYLGIDTENAEDDLHYWQTPGFNRATDTCVIWDASGDTVAFAEFWDLVEPHVHFNGFASVLPEHEGLGLGKYLLDWMEKRACISLRSAPEGTRVVLSQGKDVRMTPGVRFLEEHGYRVERHSYHMHIDLDHEQPRAEVPAGFTIRPYKGEAERRELVLVLWDAFHDHWGFVEEPFENYYKRWVHFQETIKGMDPKLWYLAEKDGEVAGACMCVLGRPDDPEIGWVNMLGVRRAYRRLGLGMAFLRVAFREFQRRGLPRAGLGVDASSLTGALKLYEDAGMHVARDFASFSKVLRDGVELSTQNVVAGMPAA